jgi:hypothetical protein
VANFRQIFGQLAGCCQARAGKCHDAAPAAYARSSLSGRRKRITDGLRIPAQREQRSEVGVGGHEHAILAGGVLEDI